MTCWHSPVFPQVHWRKICPTIPLERCLKGTRRRADVVGVFPNPGALLRLAGAVLVEQHDEWAAADRRYFPEQSMSLVTRSSINNTGQVKTSEPISASSEN